MAKRRRMLKNFEEEIVERRRSETRAVRRKKDKKVKIEALPISPMAIMIMGEDWFTWNKYRNISDAKMAIRVLAKKENGFEFRIGGEQ